MQLRELIDKIIARYDATGNKQAVLDYFKTKIPSLTRHQLNGMRRSGKWTFEIAEAVFANELQETDDPPAPPPQPDPQPRKVLAPRTHPAEATYTDPNLAPSSPFETEDGMTLPPALSNFEEAPVVEGQRSSDIRTLDPRRSSTRSPGPSVTPPRVTSDTVEAVMEVLRREGWTPPENGGSQNVSRPAVRREPPLNPRTVPIQRGLVKVRNWNEPPQKQ
jgi:hypothetical protein